MTTVWIVMAGILLGCLALMGKEYRRKTLWALVVIALAILVVALFAWYLL